MPPWPPWRKKRRFACMSTGAPQNYPQKEEPNLDFDLDDLEDFSDSSSRRSSSSSNVSSSSAVFTSSPSAASSSSSSSAVSRRSQRSQEEPTPTTSRLLKSGESSKKRRYIPWGATIQEIRRHQMSTELLIPRPAFQRMVRDISHSVSVEKKSEFDFKFQAAALGILQEASESYIVNMFRDTNLQHVRRTHTRITPKDIQLARRIRGDYYM